MPVTNSSTMGCAASCTSTENSAVRREPWGRDGLDASTKVTSAIRQEYYLKHRRNSDSFRSEEVRTSTKASHEQVALPLAPLTR